MLSGEIGAGGVTRAKEAAGAGMSNPWAPQSGVKGLAFLVRPLLPSIDECLERCFASSRPVRKKANIGLCLLVLILGLTWFALRPDPMPRMKLEWLRYSVPVNELEHPVEFTIRNPAWRR